MCTLGVRGLCTVLLVSVLCTVLAAAAGVSDGFSAARLSSCRLKFDNGSEINLMMVAAGLLDAPRFQDVSPRNTSDNNTYSYNPCYSYVYPSDGESMACSKDVAVCQGSPYGYFNLGTQSSATFHYSNETHQWVITYTNFNGNRVTNVMLQCSTHSNDTLDVWGETEEKSVYNMTLISRCACVDGCGFPILPRGMSMGSFLLLVFLLLIITYLLVGYLYRRFMIGARGIELFPHLSFWREFPYLVQDGFLFIVKCGQDDLTYERI